MYKNRNIDIVVKLIIVNIFIFLLLNFIHIILFLFNSETFFSTITSFYSVPSHLKRLLTHFWTPLIYMFSHVSFWHLLGNMLWLYFLGEMLIAYIDEKNFFALYLLGGLSGALLYIIAYNIFPVFSTVKIFSTLIGASAAVTAIVIAMTTLKPQQEVFLYGIFKVKLIYIGVFMLIYDLFLLTGSNAGGHFAHLGGAIYGFVYAQNLKKGKNIQKKFANFVAKIMSLDLKRKTKFSVYRSKLHTNDDFEYGKAKADLRHELDRILDKISKYGYNSLSQKEKEFLKKYSDRI